MLGDLDFSVIAQSWQYLIFTGMAFTIKLTLIAMVGGIALGTVLALMRLSSNQIIASIAGVYVNLLRSIPLLLVIFWFYFLVPYIGAWVTGSETPLEVGALTSSVITFTLFQAAYYCEIMRAGIQAVPKGQSAASHALGMTYTQTMWHVILPQAFRGMLPVLLTQTIVLFQDVSLVYVLSITDFVGAASKIADRDGRMVEMYLFVALVYFVMCFGLSQAVGAIQKKTAIVR
jgi:glutamate/aspartate transport system permease protein